MNIIKKLQEKLNQKIARREKCKKFGVVLSPRRAKDEIDSFGIMLEAKTGKNKVRLGKKRPRHLNHA